MNFQPQHFHFRRDYVKGASPQRRVTSEVKNDPRPLPLQPRFRCFGRHFPAVSPSARNHQGVNVIKLLFAASL